MCAAAARALGKRLISSHEAAAVIALAEQPRPAADHEDEAATSELHRRAASEEDMTRIIDRALPLATRGTPRLEEISETIADDALAVRSHAIRRCL